MENNILVRIIKNYDWPNIFRQTPKGKGVWSGIKFTEDEISDPDFIVVLNWSSQKISTTINKNNVWLILQEPPNEFFKMMHKGNNVYSRIFTQDITLTGKRFVHSQPAIPWFINMTYDELKKCKIPKKNKTVSLITSLKSNFLGHKKRLVFARMLKRQLDVDIIATSDYYIRQNPQITHKEIEAKLLNKEYTKVLKDKWDALASYKYSIVIENYKGPHYFSEKLIDCFLTWTFPIYFGCINLGQYFPKESFISIDIDKPDSINKIKEVLGKDIWSRKLRALNKARTLVLEKYQFFPYMAKYVKEWQKMAKTRKKENIIIPKQDSLLSQAKMSLFSKLRTIIK